MDSEVIKANNNYPFKTDDNYIWFIAIEDNQVIGFIPVEQKRGKKAIINNYYVAAEGVRREDICSKLLSFVIETFKPEGWILDSITLTQDKAIFEKFEFSSLDKKWTRYIKMRK